VGSSERGRHELSHVLCICAILGHRLELCSLRSSVWGFWCNPKVADLLLEPVRWNHSARGAGESIAAALAWDS
jgi:hypothetical protein